MNTQLTRHSPDADLLAAYREGCEDGAGFQVGPDMPVAPEVQGRLAINAAPGWTWLRDLGTHGICLARANDGDLVVVGPSADAWGVTVAAAALTIHSSEFDLMEAWRVGSAVDGEWLDDGTGTPEEAAHRAGWEILHHMEDWDGAILARPATSRALYVVSDFGGARAVQVAS